MNPTQLKKALAAVVAVFILSSSIRAADIITPRDPDAKRIAGEIKQITKDSITIMTGVRKDKKVVVEVNTIRRVNWNGEPAKANTLRNAEVDGRSNGLQTALVGFKAMLADTKITHTNLRLDLEYYVARVTAKLALADPTKADEAITKLEAFRRSHPSSYHNYDSLMQLGRVLQAKKDYQKAIDTFRKLGQAKWPDVKLVARNAEAGVLLAKKDGPGALAIYTEVLSKAESSPSMKTIAINATIGKAACLHQTKENAKSISVLNGIIENAAKTDSRMLASAYVLQGDCYQALGQNKDALLAYLHVDILFANQREYHPRALYHLSNLWATLGNSTRGDTAKALLKSAYPNSEWAQKK